jgi:hypothetical protein
VGKGATRSRDRAALRGGTLRPSVIPFNLLMNVTDGNPGVATGVIRKLKQGNLMFFGALCYVTFTKVSGSITDTFDGDFSIGTTADANGALAAGDIDIINTTPMGAATAGVSPRIRALTPATSGVLTSNVTIFDNTAADLELNLNVLIDDAAISGAAVLRAKGTLFLATMKMGDD